MLRCLGRSYWREESIVCEGVWEQGAGEKRVQSLTVFGNRVLEIGEDRLWRCLG